MYAIFAAAAFFLLPVTIATLLLAPALLWQIFTIIPTYSLRIAQKKHPLDHGLLFMEGIEQIDPSLAKEYEGKIRSSETKSRGWIQAIRESFDDKMHFWTYSLIALSFSLIPLIGGVFTAALQTYIVSHKLATKVLDTYMTKIEKMNKHEELAFVNKHWSLLLGFSLPFVFLSAIPIAGSFILVYAEVAVAELFYREIYKKEIAPGAQR
ncbi:2 TM domain-containing transmembrane protein [Acrasis kona]